MKAYLCGFCSMSLRDFVIGHLDLIGVCLQVLEIDLAAHVESRFGRYGEAYVLLVLIKERIERFCRRVRDLLGKILARKRTNSIVACSFSRLKAAQRSPGVAEPPTHSMDSVDLVKHLPIAQGEQFLPQDPREPGLVHPAPNGLQNIEDLLMAEALLVKRSRKSLGGLFVHRQSHGFRFAGEDPLVDDIRVAYRRAAYDVQYGVGNAGRLALVNPPYAVNRCRNSTNTSRFCRIVRAARAVMFPNLVVRTTLHRSGPNR